MRYESDVNKKVLDVYETVHGHTTIAHGHAMNCSNADARVRFVRSLSRSVHAFQNLADKIVTDWNDEDRQIIATGGPSGCAS